MPFMKAESAPGAKAGLWCVERHPAGCSVGGWILECSALDAPHQAQRPSMVSYPMQLIYFHEFEWSQEILGLTIRKSVHGICPVGQHDMYEVVLAGGTRIGSKCLLPYWEPSQICNWPLALFEPFSSSTMVKYPQNLLAPRFALRGVSFWI